MKYWLGGHEIQVFIGIVLGSVIGSVFPNVGITLQPLADGFMKLIEMLLAPVIFGTIVVGLAKLANLQEVGRIGVRALRYFEVAFDPARARDAYRNRTVVATDAIGPHTDAGHGLPGPDAVAS